MARKLARVAAMQLIYEQLEGGDGGEETLRGLIGFEPAEAPRPDGEDAAEGGETQAEEQAPVTDQEYEEDCAFIRALVSGAAAHAPELDEQIASYLRGWTLDRVARVDLAILRLAFYELTYVKDTPERVVINEAVEMAKRYSTDKSGAFVNGVLGAFSRRDQA